MYATPRAVSSRQQSGPIRNKLIQNIRSGAFVLLRNPRTTGATPSSCDNPSQRPQGARSMAKGSDSNARHQDGIPASDTSLAPILSKTNMRIVIALSVTLAALTLSARPVLAAGSLIISEFRLRGLNGPNDEFIEIYNDNDAPHTVAAISGTGYAIAASDGIVRCTIPNGTVIPARGHWLCVNSAGYALGTYPAGNGTTATGDGT